MLKLSEKQREIVEYDNVPICVKASAGSGKTRILTERIRYQLSQTKKKILALTFTNRASEEIKERLSNIENLEKRLFVGTFHGFCQYVLENHGGNIGFSIMPHIFEDDKDRLEIIAQAIEQVPSYYEKYQKLTTKEKNDFKYRALNFISKVKRELIVDTEFHKHTDDENIILLYTNYQELLKSQNAIDFDDLLLETYRLFIEYPHIASLYRRSFFSICIDEAQDLNHAQYNLIIALCNGEFNNIMMVGDPKQSIYYFNGSSSKYMLENFVKDFSPKIFVLHENFRSSKKVIEASSKIMSLSDKTLLSNTVFEGIFDIFECKDEKQESECVINKIKELLSIKKHPEIEGDITLNKMVVLARNKYVFKNLEKKLNEEKIPFYYKMTPGVINFETKVIKIFDLKLRIKLNPMDILHKMQVEQLQKNIDKTSVIANIDSAIAKLSDDGSNFKKIVTELKEYLIKEDFEDDLKKMIVDDIDEFLEHWIKYAKNNEKTSLQQFRNYMALGKTASLQKDQGITLSTVHTMKGQEYDIVFIIGADDGTFPDYRAIKKAGVDLEQEKNNLYVAFTRAKRFLYVLYPKQRLMPWGDTKNRYISRFLKDFKNKVVVANNNSFERNIDSPDAHDTNVP